MKAYVTAQLTQDGINTLSNHLELSFGGWGYTGVKLTTQELAENAKGHDILIIGYEDIDEYVLQHLPELKYIACTRGGIENIDPEVVKRYNVALSNTPGRNASAVADLTIGLMLAASRFIPQTYRYIMDERWDDVPWDIAGNTPYKRFAGIELEGKTLGLLGFGAIAKKVAKRALGFDMNVITCDPYFSPGEWAGRVHPVDFSTLLAESDFLSLHCKLTKETQEIINRENIKQMKMTSYLINTARGGLVNEVDLYEALKYQEIAGAALDVLTQEPMKHDHPFLELNNIVITPHIGGASHDIVKHQTRMVVQDVLLFLDGKKAVHAIV